MPAWKPDQSGNPSGRPRRKPVSALFDTDGLAVLDNCQEVIDSEAPVVHSKGEPCR